MLSNFRTEDCKSVEAFAAHGRVLLVGEDGGVRAYEVATGQALGFLPVRDPRSILVRSENNELIVCGDEGLNRWPLEIRLDAQDHSVAFGEREEVFRGSNFKQASLDAAGRHIAVASAERGKGAVMDLALSERMVSFGSQPGMESISLSPKGDFVATGTWGGTGVKVWEAATGNLLADLPTESRALVAFSPDGRWLAVDSENDWLYEVGSWKRAVALRFVQHEGAFNNLAFSPDGRTLATGNRSQGIHLFLVANGKELAVIDPPFSGDIVALRFSPDGTQLAVLLGSRDVQLWDLRLIRQRLAAMGLDWDQPPFPPAGGTLQAKPLR